MNLSDEELKTYQIFHPYAFERQAPIVDDQNVRFVHYTDANAALNMLQTKEIWMRNATLHARTDPWISVWPYVAAAEAGSTNVSVMIARSSGHVGFHERGYADAWHDRMIDEFLLDLIAGAPGHRDLQVRA